MRDRLGTVSGSEAEELGAVIADAEAMLDEDLFAANMNYYDLDALNEYRAIDELVQTQVETSQAVKEAGDFATMKQLVDEGTVIINEGCRVLGEDVGLTFEEVCEMARNREALGYYG